MALETVKVDDNSIQEAQKPREGAKVDVPTIVHISNNKIANGGGRTVSNISEIILQLQENCPCSMIY